MMNKTYKYIYFFYLFQYNVFLYFWLVSLCYWDQVRVCHILSRFNSRLKRATGHFRHGGNSAVQLCTEEGSLTEIMKCDQLCYCTLLSRVWLSLGWISLCDTNCGGQF